MVRTGTADIQTLEMCCWPEQAQVAAEKMVVVLLVREGKTTGYGDRSLTGSRK